MAVRCLHWSVVLAGVLAGLLAGVLPCIGIQQATQKVDIAGRATTIGMTRQVQLLRCQ